MVLQVLPDRQVDESGDADRAQIPGRPDAGEHQDLRGTEGAARHDDLPGRVGTVQAAAFEIFDAPGGGVLDDDPRHQRAGLDAQVLARHRRPQKGRGGGGAPAVADGVLAAPESLLAGGVVVLRVRNAAGLGGLDPGRVERVCGPGEFRAERTGAAAPGVFAPREGLAPLEIGQHVRIGPAGRTLLRPAIEIGRIAARIGHHIDRGRAAEHLAAAGLDGASVEIGLGLGDKSPVEHSPLVELAHAERNVNVGVPVAPAGFDQQHLGARILAQPVGEHAAGRAGADDDVVVARGWHGRSDPAQYGRAVPLTVVRSISRR
jgi:hypothetical protein